MATAAAGGALGVDFLTGGQASTNRGAHLDGLVEGDTVLATFLASDWVGGARRTVTIDRDLGTSCRCLRS